MIRLNKYLAMSGICSRRKADELIQNGLVTVNGNIINSLGTSIDEEKDIVEYNRKIVKTEEKLVYIMLNKPRGYVTTSIEQASRPYVMELIHENVRVYPIGRLDMDTEGLLLFTNDGEFANSIMHPSKKIEKTYIAKVLGNITEEKIEMLRSGVDIGGYVTKEANVKQISKNTLKITIHEGKKRQVRLMCKAAFLDVKELKRIKIGNLELGNLKVGEYRKLTKKEINKIYQNNI